MASPKVWAPWVQLTTPRVLLPYTVTSLVVGTQEGMHEWAQLTVRYQLPLQFSPVASRLPPSMWWPEDSPVQISYGATSADSATFWGYVVSPELMSDPGQQPGYVGVAQMLDVRYTLLGTTKPLQTATTRTWRQCTVAYMAQQIAARAGLVAVVDPHPRVFQVRQQAATSDYHFLQERSDESGWRLAVSGTTIYLTDPHRPLVATTPTFVQNRTPGVADTMQKFRATVGETDPAGAVRAQHVSVGLSHAGVVATAQTHAIRTDPVTGADVPPQVQRYDTSYVANSYADASAITEAAAMRDLWWVHATATVDGDVRLRPGCVVNLGGTALPSQYTGAWMTRSARHYLTISPIADRMSTYYCDLELGRDQPDSLTQRPYVTPPRVSTSVVAGRWVGRPGVTA